MKDIYKNIEEYNQCRRCNALLVFDKMIADISSNKIFNQVVTELFIRGRKLNIFTVFITQTHFSVPKDIRLNHTHFFIMKISNKREL